MQGLEKNNWIILDPNIHEIYDNVTVMILLRVNHF